MKSRSIIVLLLMSFIAEAQQTEQIPVSLERVTQRTHIILRIKSQF